MGLLTPWFLAGLAAIVVPLLLHLVRREEPAGRPFPSLMFLRQIPVKTRRRKTLRDPLLLALRCLALALLALAFAGPYLPASVTAPAAGAGEVDRVFLIDRSYSMGYPGQWSAAIDAVRERISGLATGERAAVVAFDSETRTLQALTADRNRLQRAIDGLRPGYGNTDYAAAFDGAARLLRDSSAAQQEVVLVSDLQRAGLDGIRTPRLAAEIGLQLVPIGPPTGSNAAVMNVELLPRRAASDGRQTLAVRLGNTGSEPASAVRVVTLVDDHAISELSFGLGPRSERTVEIPLVIARDHTARVRVQLDADGAPADDIFDLVLGGAPPAQVTVVEPDQHRSAGGFFLYHALTLARAPGFDVALVPVSNLNGETLAPADVVILNDVAVPGDARGRALSDFVARGGGLLVLAGPGVRGHWPGGGAGPLPGRLGPMVARNEVAGRILELRGAHPLQRALQEAFAGGLAPIDVYRYRKLLPHAEDRVLARFDDDAPALIERTGVSGRVLVMTTTLDPQVSTLAFAPAFAPLVIDAVRFLANRPPLTPYVRLGDTFDVSGQAAALPGGGALRRFFDQQRDIVVEPPDGETVRLRAGAALYTPRLPGFHEFHAGGAGGGTVPVAVNADRVESDLAAVGEEAFHRTMQRPATARIGAADVAARRPGTPATTGAGLWWWALITVAVLLALEAWFANRLAIGGGGGRSQHGTLQTGTS